MKALKISKIPKPEQNTRSLRFEIDPKLYDEFESWAHKHGFKKTVHALRAVMKSLVKK